MKIEKFEKRLIDTMHWCHSEMMDHHVRTKLPGNQFFHKLTSYLQPATPAELKRNIEQTAHVRGSVLRRFAPESMGKFLKLHDAGLESEVAHVSVQRAEAVILRHYEETESIAMAAGKLLYFTPALSRADGKAMLASGGFFDGENFPPSDTWMAYVIDSYDRTKLTGYLLSWVPSPVVSLVEHAMKADTSGSLRWAASMETPFLAQVRQRVGYSM